MKGLSLKEKILIMVLIIMAVFYGYYRFFLTPMMSSINDKKVTIESLKEQEQKIKEAPYIKEKLTAQLNEKTVLFDAAVLEVPQEYRNSEIAYRIKALCDVNSTALNSISLGQGRTANGDPSQQQSSDGICRVPVSISMTGSYINTMKLIKALEGDTRLAQVESIGMNSETEGENITSGLTMTYYYIDKFDEDGEVYSFNKGAYGKTDLFN